MKLHQAFEITRGDVVAFIGAGGKSSALIGLGYELSESGWRVLATTTTSIDEDQLDLFPHAMYYDANPQNISNALSEHGFVFLYHAIRGGRVYGPAVEWTRQLLDTIDSDVLLIEADKSNGMPLKVPYESEPVIPEEASLVIPVASLSAVNQPLDESHIYNPQPIIEKYGFYAGSPIRMPWIAQIMRDEEIGLRGIPPQARVMAFLNQTPPDGYIRARASLIARMMLKSSRIKGVVLGSVRASDPVCEVQRHVSAVVLAAGQSSRMGSPKVLLPWTKGKTILEHIIDQLVRSRIEMIEVVTGAYADDVKRLLKPLDLTLVHNRAYRNGEMLSSLQAGLRALPEHVSAALIVLGDQPRIQPRVIYDLLKAYAEGAGDLLIPSFEKRRGHPILVGRKYWQEFLNLEAHQTPRDVFKTYESDIRYVVVDTDSILGDVDTPSDYKSERHKAGLQQDNNEPPHFLP